MLVSIVVNNHNYGRFLRDAIDSALDQKYHSIEVIVVDDGSTDDSRQVMTSYGDRILPVWKRNGGQGSAFNAGFAKSRGEVVIFLDADDALLPDAVECIMKEFRPGVSKVHWPLWRADENLRSTGLLFPPEDPGRRFSRIHAEVWTIDDAEPADQWKRFFTMVPGNRFTRTRGGAPYQC
ncbi:MAG: glycosyltransferase family A protein [Gemmatimonadaceae bacterium]